MRKSKGENHMGLLLNTLSPAVLYEEMAKSTYFVDKTAFIGQMLQRIGTNGKYVCITRPRRFGKTVMANMLGAFLTKSAATAKLFAQLKIGRDAEAMQHINQYNVIYIDFSRISSNDYSHNRNYTGQCKRRQRLENFVNEASWSIFIS